MKFKVGLICSLLLALSPVVAVAGAVGTQTGAIINGVAVVTPATTTTAQVLVTGAGAGSVIEKLYCYSNGLSANTSVMISTLDGATTHNWFKAFVVANGDGATSPVNDLLTVSSGTVVSLSSLPLDQFGNAVIYVASGQVLQIAPISTISQGSFTCRAMGLQYF